jgi:hypothetical protein
MRIKWIANVSPAACCRVKGADIKNKVPYIEIPRRLLRGVFNQDMRCDIE